MRLVGPGPREFGAMCDYKKYPGGSHTADEIGEKFQAGGIDPVDVFKYYEERRVARETQKSFNQDLERTVLPALGRKVQSAVLSHRRQCEQ